MAARRMTDEQLERLLGPLAIRPKYKVAVRRVEPKWCAGYLGTIDVDCRDDISFEAIRDEFGGGKFYFKIKDGFGSYLSHRSARIAGPPLRNGLPIYFNGTAEDLAGKTEKRKKEPTCECASLRKRLEELSERVDDLEGQVEAWEDRQRQAEALVKRALKLAESGEAESKALVAIERMRENREAKDAALFTNLLLLGAMILLVKMD